VELSMSEEPVAVTAQPIEAGQQTAGQLLRAAREATGLHIAALAVAMKVPVKKLEALEADRLDELPDAVFVRALAGSMCRALKIDPAPVLGKLPQSAVPKFERDDRGINMPYRAPDFQDSSSLKALVTKPVFLMVIALLIAALAVLLVPETRSTAPSADTPATPLAATPAEATAPVVKEVSNTPGAIANLVPPVISPSPLVQPAPAALVATAVLAAVPVRVASAATASSAAAPASALRPPAGPEVIAFKVKSSTWIRVTDAKGSVQFEKTLAAGETASAYGPSPLTVVVGNASATEASVRGQPFALDAYAKDNVARFEVK
jgi:cytoskeleton protein RodZ